MNVIGYTALHYGRDYLAYAIRSIIAYIDEYHVLYSAVGSHGHSSNGARCPETRDELYAIAQQAAGDKLRWHDGTWAHEGLQRDSIHQYAPDADVIIVLDADEIWPEHLAWAVSRGELDRHMGVSRLRLPMIHFWRSMQRAIMHDPAYPERAIYPKSPGGVDTYWSWKVGEDNDPRHGTTQCIAHLGYAQRPEIVEYKLKVHGHKNEFRRDVDWFNDVFLANRQYDCHPVGSDHWQPETVDPLDYLPAWIAKHPYYGLEVIE